MKIWCTLNRNPANRCRESWALWSSFPVAYVSKIFFGNLLYLPPLTNQTAWGKVSLKSLEITNDSRAVSYQLLAVT